MEKIIAHMPSMVVEILVTEGQNIKEGDSIMILNSMKMDMLINSPYCGIIEKIYCEEGKYVQPDSVLVTINNE